jgi:hypothetical protein
MYRALKFGVAAFARQDALKNRAIFVKLQVKFGLSLIDYVIKNAFWDDQFGVFF